MTLFAERTDSIPIDTALYKFDFVAGATVEASIFDPLTGNWLANWGTGAWGATKASQVLGENPEFPGHYFAFADLTQADPSSTHLSVIFEVTAGGSGSGSGAIVLVGELYDMANATDQASAAAVLSAISSDLAGKAEPGDAMGLTGAAVDAIHREQLGDHSGVAGSVAEALDTAASSTAPTAVAVANQVDATLSSTHGAGNWEGGGAAPTVGEIWGAILANYSAPGNAAETLLGAGGAFTPAQVADAVLSALTNDYKNDTGSVGKALHDMDAETLRVLLEAAVGKLTRLGYAFGTMPQWNFFVGDVGIPLRLPVLVDGKLADVTGATVSWRFVDPSDGSTLTKAGVVSGTPGHVEYVTANGDGVIDSPGQWRAQATVTFPDTSVKVTEIGLATVSAAV